MMKRLLLTTVLLIIIISAIAQPPRGGGHGGGMPQISKGIMGRVVDANTSTPIEYANIALLKIKDSSLIAGTISNEKGFFILDKVPNGIYNMRIKFIGYKSHSINKIEISDNNPVIRLKALKLETANIALESVDVTAKQEDVIFKIDKRVVNVSENVNAAGGTAVDALENTPGVEVDIDGNVSIRGSSNFTVLIDGKPTAMEGNEALQQIPASSIQEIEIITNPSAKYDPDGLTGILNIILKKDLKGGINGVVSASVGNREQYNASANFNYRKNKLNIIAGYSFRQGTRGGVSETYNKTFRNDTILFRDEDGERGHKRLNNNLKLGFDYDFDDKNMISLAGNYRISSRDRFNDSYYTTYTNPETITTDSYTEGENTDDGNSYELSGVYIHKFNDDKHELRFMGTYSSENNEEESYTSFDTLGIDTDIFLETLTQTTNDHENITAQVDYTLPIGSSKFEAGAKSSLRNIDYNQSGDIYNPLPGALANDFRYLEDIHSFYAIYAGPIGGFEYQAGLRGEYSKVETELLSTSDKNVREIFTVYPTLHVSYDFNEANKIQAGYSRRVNRPRTYFLNPYEERMDAFTIRKGNPELDPEYAHSFETNYLKYIGKAFINTTVFYRQTDNNIGRVQKINDENMNVMTFDNINKESSLGVEVSARNKFTKWLSINASYSFFKYNVEGNIDGVDLSNQSLNHKINGNANINIGRNASLQMFGMYYSPSVTSQGEREAFYFTGLGYKHLFFDKRLTLTARVRNPLGNFKWEFTTTGSNFENYIIRRPYSPMFNVGLSYRINEGFKRRKMDNGEGTSEDFNENMSID